MIVGARYRHLFQQHLWFTPSSYLVVLPGRAYKRALGPTSFPLEARPVQPLDPAASDPVTVVDC